MAQLVHPILSIPVMALAIWRVYWLLAHDDGPFDVFQKIRYLIGVRYNAYSIVEGRNNFARGWLCLYCVSMWWGIAVTLGYIYYPFITVAVCLPFALSALAIIAGKAIE